MAIIDRVGLVLITNYFELLSIYAGYPLNTVFAGLIAVSFDFVYRELFCL